MAGGAFAVGVIVGGGVNSWSEATSLIIVVALWSVPGLAGSAVSRIVTNRWWITPAVVRASVATTLMVALVKNLPVHTSVETTTNLYVTEFAWLLAATSLLRSRLDHSVASVENSDRRAPSRNRLMTTLGLMIVIAKFSEPAVRAVWTVAAVIALAAVVLWRLRFETRLGSSARAGWIAIGAVLVVGVAAVSRGQTVEERIESSGSIDLVASTGTTLSPVVVDVDSYPFMFDTVLLPDQRVMVKNDDLGAYLMLSSVLSDGGVVPVGEDRLRLVTGHMVRISGEGLAAGSPIETWLFSTPQQLGAGSVSSQGRIDVTVPVGDDLPLGDHELRIRFTLNDGQSALVTVPVVVAATAPGQSL